MERFLLGSHSCTTHNLPSQYRETQPGRGGGLESQQTPFCAQQGTQTLLRTAVLLQGSAGMLGVLRQDSEKENHSSSKAWDSTEPQPEQAKLQKYSVTFPCQHKELELPLQTAPHTPTRPGTSWKDWKNTPEPELVSPHSDPAQIPSSDSRSQILYHTKNPTNSTGQAHPWVTDTGPAEDRRDGPKIGKIRRLRHLWAAQHPLGTAPIQLQLFQDGYSAVWTRWKATPADFSRLRY